MVSVYGQTFGELRYGTEHNGVASMSVQGQRKSMVVSEALPRIRCPGPLFRRCARLLIFALLPALLWPVSLSRAFESDQYSNRLVPISDSIVVLDNAVNEAILRIASEWDGPEDRRRFATEVWRTLGGAHWVDRIERLAMESPDIERLPQTKRENIYSDAPFRASPVIFLFGVARTIKLAGSLTGTDKLGHFFSQGFKYFRSHLKGWSEERIANRGRFNERWIFGRLTTSVYSNADLVANWEGYLFYRSLFEDGIIPGKSRIVRFRDGRAEVVRPFTWADHVNDYWDEALNPSYWNPTLERVMHAKLEEYCSVYLLDPNLWVSPEDEELGERYAAIGLRLAPENRLDHLCASSGEEQGYQTPMAAVSASAQD